MIRIIRIVVVLFLVRAFIIRHDNKAERVFSLAGRVFNDYMYTQNMQSQKLEERMWANVNAHAIKKLEKKVASAVAEV